MIASLQEQILSELHRVCELSPDIRFGQIIANLAFLAEDAGRESMWDIDDESLLQVIQSHRADLTRRQRPATSLHSEAG
jgi:hypothetical protein